MYSSLEFLGVSEFLQTLMVYVEKWEQAKGLKMATEAPRL